MVGATSTTDKGEATHGHNLTYDPSCDAANRMWVYD